jgi:cytochrome c553
MMRTLVLCFIFGITAISSAGLEGVDDQVGVMNLTPDLNNGRDVYELCAVCHAAEGWGEPDGSLPMIAGQHRDVLIKQLADIRAGNRDNPTMYPFAIPSALGGAQAIADVTAYIAKLPMNPTPGIGTGDDLEHGQKIYKENCVECHGSQGEGDSEKYYPRIHGQQYQYLLRQFMWIREGKRRNANQALKEQIRKFSDRDIKAVVDYVSRLRPPHELVAEPGWTNPDFD